MAPVSITGIHHLKLYWLDIKLGGGGVGGRFSLSLETRVKSYEPFIRNAEKNA
jgi:hypothetical protein